MSLQWSRQAIRSAVIQVASEFPSNRRREAGIILLALVHDAADISKKPVDFKRAADRLGTGFAELYVLIGKVLAILNGGKSECGPKDDQEEHDAS